MEIKDRSRKALVYILKYQANELQRNTIKLEIIDSKVKNNVYQPKYFSEISRFINCQTEETMFANKLVSLTDRYKQHRQIAGRDLYDVHFFFLQGFSYLAKIIEERTQKSCLLYFKELHQFVTDKVTQRIINEDLNFLLPQDKFKHVRKYLKPETLRFIQEEIEKLS